MKQLIYRGLLLGLMASPVLASDAKPGEVRKVDVSSANGAIRIHIELSTPVTPSVEKATNPARLVVTLPHTACSAQQKRIPVGKAGVLAVRYGLNQSDPPETHLVVDLDHDYPYKLATSGNEVNLLIEGAAISAKQRNAPPPAASRSILSSLIGGRRKENTPQNPDDRQQPDVPMTSGTPNAPFEFPSASPQSGSQTASNRPSAQQPNRGGLQEGTVFPNEGTPGTGAVPPLSGVPAATGLDLKSAGNKSATSTTTEQAQFPLAVKIPDAPSQEVASLPAAVGKIMSLSLIPLQTPLLPIPTPLPPSRAEAISKPDATPVDARPGSEVQVASAPTSSATSDVEATGAPESPQPAQTTDAATKTAAETSDAATPQLKLRPGENTDLRTAFRVKYVAEDAAYLDGGRAAGLTEGMKLEVRDLPNGEAVAATGTDATAAGDVAELVVLSVAETSSVTEIHTSKRPVKVGDLAYLSSADQQALVEKNALSATRKYPAVVSFTENDTLDDEARAEVPKPPLPSVNRARGRIGFDYIGVASHEGSGLQTSNLGMVVATDITRINGTYWNVSGYWRGRFNHTSGGTPTIQDTINRTYHLYTNYTNPQSDWVAGFGRMYLPWATSLETIDGGYVGRKFGPGMTTGVFLGSTPDPTSYSYAPNREIGGWFINFQGGSYDDLHYTSTTGAGLDLLKWSVDRPFVFFENTISYKNLISLYQASQLDNKQGYWYFDPTKNAQVWQPGTGWGAGRSFTTVRVQPHPRVEINFNQTYFRDLPTFDPSLIATGLLDKYLFQGFSAGARVEILKQIWVSSDTGFSNHSGDQKNSLNQMVGLTFGRLPWIGLHADLHYSQFNSSFGSGTYESISVSKNLADDFQLQVLAGQQNFSSTVSSATRSRFVNAMVEKSLGQHYFVQGGATISRGGSMNYDQWIFTFGYRFDNRHGHKGQ